MTAFKISVIMPSLNEANNITAAVQNVLEGFRQFEINGQIVIVNDGSSDKTGEIAEDLCRQNPSIKVLHHQSPQGIGASFWDGVWQADGEIVTMIPGDGENDAPETLRYLGLMDHVDILIPFVYNKSVRSSARRLLSTVYRGIINMAFGMTLNYMNGTVMYRKCILEGLAFRSKGFFYQTELLIRTLRNGYLFAEVPYALNLRVAGTSKATTFKSLVKVTNNFISLFINIHFGEQLRRPLAPGSVTAARWKALTR